MISKCVLIFLQGARIIKSSHFLKRYHLGRKISLVCVARGNPRPHVTWLKDGLELNSYAGYEGVGVRRGCEIITETEESQYRLTVDPRGRPQNKTHLLCWLSCGLVYWIIILQYLLLFSQVSEWRIDDNYIKSKLDIDPAMPKDAGFYECQADNKYAIDRKGFIAKYELN